MISKPDEIRLAILSATQQGNLAEIIRLLDKDPALLQSKTTSTGSSLLHIAAERGHDDVCNELLNRGHDTNPLDKNDRTPYQRAEKDSIKRLLANKHCDYLINKYFSARLIPAPNFPHIKNISANYAVLSLIDFFDLFKSRGFSTDDAVSKFAVTIMRHEKNVVATDALDYIVSVYFREDFLMQPFYGDLLVIHENEQAKQQFELLHDGVKNVNQVSQRELNRFETRSYLTIIARALEMFPFLANYPTESDSPAIKEAKKMFIRFTLCDFALYYQLCNEQQIAYLQRLKDYDRVTDFVTEMISKKNSPKYTAISEEMTQKYIKDKLAIAEGNNTRPAAKR